MKKLLLLFSFVIAVLSAVVAQAQSNSPANNGNGGAKPAPLSMLTPPRSFAPSAEFNGYSSEATGASIILLMLDNIVYTTMEAAMTPEVFAQNKVEMLKKIAIETSSGLKGVAFKLSFTVNDITLIRYMVYVGDLEKTLWVNMNYPQINEDLVEDELLKSLNSIAF